MTPGTPSIVLGLEPEHDVAMPLLRRAADIASRLNAQLEVVRVLEPLSLTVPPSPLAGGMGAGLPVPPDVEAEEHALERLRTDLMTAGALGRCPWTAHVLFGPPAVRLLTFADEVDAYLIAVGVPSSGVAALLHHLASGSVAHDLERQSRRPLLLLPRD